MPVVTFNPDIERERDKCSFVPSELTYLLDGDENKTKERRAREEFFLSDPELQDKIPSDYLSHKEKYEEAVRKACVVLKKIQYLQEKENTGVENYREVLGGMLGSAVTRDGSPIALHYIMFIPTLMGQGTVAQQAEWIGRAWSCGIIGTYAQTELGHGTFIRGLETTATYDAKTKEFILNSPTITSYKWWPGGLGQTANYAVVVAQLNTQGVCHGIHPFIVQLRDEDTHFPMPGIKIGDIGVKLGMNSTNNGYLGFDNVRIPREHMLMKNAKVLEDGTYVKSPSSKLTYGTMVFVRVVIVQDVANQLSKAVTIAIRYSAVRRQSQPKPDEAEPQIMDYVTQQHKLFPALAATFAFKFAAGWIWDLYNNVIGELDAGDLDRLPELHALTCCLKAVSTSESARYIEQCRLSCGGHGYMSCSGLPTIYGLVTAACTYEGENTILFLQTARFLMKAFQQAGSGASMTPTVQYLSEITSEYKWVNNVFGIVEGLKRVALGKIESCATVLDQRVKDGFSYEDAWNMTSIRLVAAAQAHCNSFILETFVKETDRIFSKATRALRNVMNILVELFAVNAALEVRGDLLMFTKITGADITILQRREEALLAKIRPDAVGIVDAFNIRDEILASALGSYDGRVYERLMEEAAKSPLNSEPVNQSFNKYLKPLMKSHL